MVLLGRSAWPSQSPSTSTPTSLVISVQGAVGAGPVVTFVLCEQLRLPESAQDHRRGESEGEVRGCLVDVMGRLGYPFDRSQPRSLGRQFCVAPGWRFLQARSWCRPENRGGTGGTRTSSQPESRASSSGRCVGTRPASWFLPWPGPRRCSAGQRRLHGYPSWAVIRPRSPYTGRPEKHTSSPPSTRTQRCRGRRKRTYPRRRLTVQEVAQHIRDAA